MIKPWMIKPPAGGDVTNYTVSLLHFNGDDNSTTFTDETGKVWTTNASAKLSTTTPKFGTASGLFTYNTGDLISTPDHSDFTLGSDNFTVECWIKTSTVNRYVFGQGPSNGANTNGSVGLQVLSNGKLEGSLCYGAVYQVVDGASSVADGAWHHCAVIRNGDNLYVATDGILSSPVDIASVTANDSSAKFAIGAWGEYPSLKFNGYIDEFRFSKGIARWTSDFSASLPSAEYPYPDE